MTERKYDKYVVQVLKKDLKGHGVALMSNALVPGSNMAIFYNWIKEKPRPNPMHQAMESHDYDEIIFNIGMDPENPEYLGGEIEGYMGEDRQIINKTTALYIPRYVEHGRVTWLDFEKPHIQMAIKMTGNIEPPGQTPKSTGKATRPPEGYNKYMLSEPLREVAGDPNTTGRSNPTYTYISNQLVPGCNMYLETGWIWDMPSPNPPLGTHSHNYIEVVLNIGTDPENPEDLGAKIESYMGDEKQVSDKTHAVYLPKNMPHGPVTWKRVSRPHIQMSLVIGTGNFSEALPGGFG